MDRIVLSWHDAKRIGLWAVDNKKLVYNYPVPLKNLQIILNKTWIADIERRGNKVKIRHTIDGLKRGMQVFKLGKSQKLEFDNTGLQGPDIATILMTYVSTMAYMVYAKENMERLPRKTAVHRAGAPSKAGNGYTYILHKATTTVPQGGHHRSPQGTFSVRGHYRHYKTGKTVWIAEYRKGTGKSQRRQWPDAKEKARFTGFP